MTNHQNNIAFIFDDLTEFFVMRKPIDALIKAKVPLDIIVPYDSGYNNLPEHTFRKITELGYYPIKDAPKNKKYKVILTPYPTLKIIQRLNFIYHLRIPYSTISAKPNPVYTPMAKMNYDCIICFNNYEPTFLTAYGADCRAIPYWEYYNFKKTPNQSTPNLLILPTFGEDTSCIELLSPQIIKKIKKHYHVIIKAHHAIHFNADGTNMLKKIKNLGDEFYDSDTPITSLLKRADIVLSDNSGSIFEAIYSNTPVASFSKDLNSRHLGTINTLQYQLSQNGILPHTSQPQEVLPMLLSIDKYYEKQQQAKEQLFPAPHANSIQNFLDIIKEYILKNENKDYKKILHDIMVNETNLHLDHNAQIIKLRTEISELQAYKDNSEKIFNSRAYKIFQQVIKPYQAIKNKKSNYES